MPVPTVHGKYRLTTLSVALVLVCIFFGYIYSNIGLPHSLDPKDREVLDTAGAARSYKAHIITSANLGDRSVVIDGIYLIDRNSNSYSAVSTTTLSFKDIPTQHFFTLKNIAKVSEVYTSLETNSDIIKKTMPQTSGWKHFTRDTIPIEFQNISIPGPVSDPILILSEKGRYISFVKKLDDQGFGDDIFSHYLFRLSDTLPEKNTTVETLRNRITDSGHIDIWIHHASSSKLILRFSNPTYTSTSTISEINQPLFIDIPTN